MPISVTCECGKNLKAPDTAAGKKAKCPQCGTVIVIPAVEEPVYEAEEIADDSDADYDDDSYSSDGDALDSPRGTKSGRRRPCPACGEMILEDAAKCRYCDEVFDQKLKKGSKRAKSRPGKRRSSDSLAGPGQRFLGAFADGLALIVFLMPAFVLFIISGAASDRPGHEASAGLAAAGGLLLLLGICGLIGLQLYLMATRSQSIGKYLVKSQVMDYETQEPAGFVKIFLLRSLVNQLISSFIPFYGLVDALCVFTDEHRCLHDRIAGTYVVDIS